MNLSRKINNSLIALLIMIVVASASGAYSTFSLSGLLSFITTQAWDTADGAMEGSIGIEAQMIAVQQITAGQVGNEHQRLEEGKAMADEALERMISAGLMSAEEVNLTNQNREAFNLAKADVLAKYADYSSQSKKIEGLFTVMQEVMVEAEELGDAQVEVLESSPNQFESWNTGLSERWSAADGTMEAHIHFLEVNYYLRQYVSSSQKNEKIRQKLDQAIKAFEGTISEVSGLNVFKTNRVKIAGNDAVLATVLQARMKSLNDEVLKMVSLADAYHQALQTYNESSDQLLETIEVVEESADSKVESQTSVIGRSKLIAYSFVLFCLCLGVGIAYFAAIRVRRDIITPIENLTTNMQSAAEGQVISDHSYIDREDEIGSMAKALKVFVDLFEDNKRISEEAFRTAQALTVCNTAVLIADANKNIIFSNQAMGRLITDLSSQLSEQGVVIQSDKLLGQSIDLFNRGHEFLSQVDSLHQPQRESIKIGSLHLSIGLAPIVSDGSRVGTVLEIEDKTA